MLICKKTNSGNGFVASRVLLHRTAIMQTVAATVSISYSTTTGEMMHYSSKSMGCPGNAWMSGVLRSERLTQILDEGPKRGTCLYSFRIS